MIPVETLTAEYRGVVDPIALFSALSRKGAKNNCVLLESADIQKKIGEKSIGSVNPSLRFTGKGTSFTITALNTLGEQLLVPLKDTLSFCLSVQVSRRSISGVIASADSVVSEEERLNRPTLADVIRALSFSFKEQKNHPAFALGLFGVISYDFIDQFEKLSANPSDEVHDSDVEMLFVDNAFVIDHQKKHTLFTASFFPSVEGVKGKSRAEQLLVQYQKTLATMTPLAPLSLKGVRPPEKKMQSDTTKEEFISLVKKCKEHINVGDVFQIVLSKTLSCTISVKPFEVYRVLRELNPSPYMFYVATEDGALVGSSPETCIKVTPHKDGTSAFEIRPIAGTKSRGFKPDGTIDPDLDSRFENELKTDKKELAEHTMLIDLARNDIARVSVPGTRTVIAPHMIEKYSHVMHLVSTVTGTLKPGYDALHAYLASMNMGTLTGAPKVMAMELLRRYEKNKRGYYGGSVGYLTPDGTFDSAIIIRSIRIKGNKAYVRSGAGIVYDSVPEAEFEETEKKARACVHAIALAETIAAKERNKFKRPVRK